MKVGFEIQRALQGLLNKAAVDGGAYGHLIQHFTRHQLPLHALQLHARIVIFSITPDNFLASKLINFYTRQNRFSQALHVFDEITVRNAFSYNALVTGNRVSDKPQPRISLRDRRSSNNSLGSNLETRNGASKS